MLDQALYSLASFVTGILLARALPTHAFGLYVVIVSLVVSAIGIQRALVTTPYTVLSASRGDDELRRCTGGALLQHLVLATLCAVACAAIALQFDSQAAPWSVSAVVVLVALGTLARDFVRGILLARLRVVASLVTCVAVNLSQLAAVALLYAFERLTFVTACLAIAIPSIAGAFASFAFNTGAAFRSVRPFAQLREQFTLGKWLLGGAVLGAVVAQSYLWLLGGMAGAAAVAAFGVASSFANLPSPVLQGASAFLLPRIVHSAGSPIRNDIVRKVVKSGSTALSAVYLVWLAIGIAYGGALLELLYSSKYANLESVLVVLILYGVVSAVMAPISAALDALKRSDVAFRSTLVAGAAGMLACLLLIPRWGAAGAAAGALLANATMLGLRAWGLRAILAKAARS